MSNRTLIYMTALVLFSMVVLFALNLGHLFSGSPPNQKYLKYNDIRGMAVKYRHLPYTLNFNQQNNIVDLLNQSVAITEVRSGTNEPVDIEQIIIYQFGGQPDLILTPIAYVDDQLIYKNSAWNPNGYLMDISRGQLRDLLSKTYDHSFR